ncbi:MAG: DPP IV N-terminal domain-containing protein [Bacteroidetes bacterium]|nr:DPP IV N-terminal domain-containing protein [Bacteroidota bacterium]
MRNTILLAAILTSFTAFAQKEITLDDLYKNNTFRIKSVPGFNGMKDGKHYTQLDAEGQRQQINVYNLETGKMESTLFDNSKAKLGDKQLHIDDYTFSKDEQKILLKSESQNIYRRSVLNMVYVYDIKSGSIQQVWEHKVLHATFSPDGTKVAFVDSNNICYKDLVNNIGRRLTADGKWNEVINGNCDWVYEEEFGFTRAFDWSPNSRFLAFYRFDESKVKEFTIPMYNDLYPDNYTYKYPKAGEANSLVDIKVFDFKTEATVNAIVGQGKDQYIPRIKWSNDPSKLCIYKLNRLQNKLTLLLADATTGKHEVIYKETNPYYIQVSDALTFLKDGSSFIFESEKDGYEHLYHYNWEREKMTLLTKGKYDIAGITAIDEVNKLVYYTAAETSPMDRKLYAVGFNGRGKKTITKEDGVHSITAIEGNKFFLDKYSRLNKVPVYSLLNAKGDVVRTLEDNHELKAKLKEYNMGKIAFTTVELENGTELNAWMITPPDFDEHKKYPVLMYQYSGPNSQQVVDQFPAGNYFWHQMLAEKGYIVFCTDGTGTGFRGQEFRKKTYLQLGKYESDDQIAAAKYLGNLPYVDKNRIGIWGWSYGGFMSSTCLFKGGNVFKMGIAVAPVTNWRYYDNIYTERYMRTPQENQKGYDDNAPEKMVKGLTGKFLLIHGTADDNVHFQNSAMLINELVKANKEFDSEYYPNRNHGISGGNTRYHLYKRMTDYVLNNL